MCRDTRVTGSRVDVARALRPVWRNDATRRRLLRHREGGANNRKHDRERRHKIDSLFHSYPDLLQRIILSSEETEPSQFESQSIRTDVGNTYTTLLGSCSNR